MNRRPPESSRRKHRGLSPGFTIIELTLVTAIVATLSAIGLPFYVGYVDKARVARTVADLQMLGRTVDAFELAEGTLPMTLAETGGGAARDAWGNPYQYLNISCGELVMKGKNQTCSGKPPKGTREDKFLKPLNTDFDLYSIGPDGQTHKKIDHKKSWDDIIRALDGSYVGRTTEF